MLALRPLIPSVEKADAKRRACPRRWLRADRVAALKALLTRSELIALDASLSRMPKAADTHVLAARLHVHEPSFRITASPHQLVTGHEVRTGKINFLESGDLTLAGGSADSHLQVRKRARDESAEEAVFQWGANEMAEGDRASAAAASASQPRPKRAASCN